MSESNSKSGVWAESGSSAGQRTTSRRHAFPSSGR